MRDAGIDNLRIYLGVLKRVETGVGWFIIWSVWNVMERKCS